MAEIGQSAFLQALGWATLNSFWQMALLWAGFLVLQFGFRLSANQKYNAALLCMGLGFAWFLHTLYFFYQSGSTGSLLLSSSTFAPTSGTWEMILSSASLAYLFLLSVPAYRLFKNWQYIGYLKKYGLEKSGLEYRLFVKKVSTRLGIKKPVHVYLSHLITSPVTIGYLKPIILLPVAALNGLNTQQVEAVLLHELSHIRRYDYLVNLVITLLHTLFYFNPFVKKFVAAIESEREKCCDELVLQFQYDKLSYASALLTLEKNAASDTVLVMAAADKKYLLHRIEKIVGKEQKSGFSFHHFAGVMASFLLVILVNSLFFVSQQPAGTARDLSFTSFENPLYDFSIPVKEAHETVTGNRSVSLRKPSNGSKRATEPFEVVDDLIEEVPQSEMVVYPSDFIPVAFDATREMASLEEKEQVTATLEATKKVLTTTQWQEVEKSIADGMNEKEKVLARNEYLNEIEKVDWKRLESKLLTEYQHLDWANIQSSLGQALTSLRLDSVEKSYTKILKQLERTELQLQAPNCNAGTVLPVPDASVKEINLIKDNLRSKLDTLKAGRHKKVISL